jgi:hypothetical protein
LGAKEGNIGERGRRKTIEDRLGRERKREGVTLRLHFPSMIQTKD